MWIKPYANRKPLALLLAALLLIANALTTVHAFGESEHAVTDSCELLHQFESQQHAPVDAGSPFSLALPPLPVTLPGETDATCTAPACFRSRAPPLA